MKRIIIALVVLTSIGVFAQDFIQLKKTKPHKDYEIILVKKVSDDQNQTSFVIWVKGEVKMHKHNYHTENLYVLQGKGDFTLGGSTFQIKKGDYLTIPKQTPHAVKVTSKRPLKVVSIQSPQFLGVDRIFLDKKN